MAVYRRTVGASLDRVWENVLDWEHLPWLHRSSFADVQIQQAGAWGWRAQAVTTQGRELRLELVVERAALRYVSRTLEGEGAGTEIWTQLRVRSAHQTDVEVEFRLPEVRAAAAESVGAAYTRLYTQLWNEDEEMMRQREVRLASRRAVAHAPREAVELRLGDLESLRARLPLQVEFAGEPFWLVELGGVLRAHSAVCPHKLGPLPAAGSDGSAGSAGPTGSTGGEAGARVECPWHGYRFDVRTRASCGGRKWKGTLAVAPRVVVEAGEVVLRTPQPN